MGEWVISDNRSISTSGEIGQFEMQGNEILVKLPEIWILPELCIYKPLRFPPLDKCPEAPPPGKGTLSIRTTPVSGEIFVNGVSWGNAPVSRVIDPGRYTVSFGDVSGYKTPDSRTVTLAADQILMITGVYEKIGVLDCIISKEPEIRTEKDYVYVSYQIKNSGTKTGLCCSADWRKGIDSDWVIHDSVTLSPGQTKDITFGYARMDNDYVVYLGAGYWKD